MKKSFQDRLSAIDWIADHSDNEGIFEVLREQLSMNHIQTGRYFIEVKELNCDVIMLEEEKC
jgi:hypothetical protein